MTRRIFISYRHHDRRGTAERIKEHIVRRFGKRAVFFGHDNIRPGTNFLSEINESLDECSNLVAIIGPDWARTSGGNNDVNWMLYEIATAIEKDVNVIPVLVDGGQIPARIAQDPGLRAFVLASPLEVSDNHFDEDMRRLIEALGGRPILPSVFSWSAMAIHSAVALVGAMIASFMLYELKFFSFPAGQFGLAVVGVCAITAGVVLSWSSETRMSLAFSIGAALCCVIIVFSAVSQ